MKNFITTIILLVIAFFVINLFPMGKSFLGSIVDSFNEKRTNVTDEYKRVKDKVDAVKTTVTETKENIDNTIEGVNKAVDSASEAVDSLNKLVGNDKEEDTAKTEEAPVTDTAPQE